MLDPLSALSVAAATVAFVDFGYKLVSETKRTYTDASGATKENVTITEVAEDIHKLNEDLEAKCRSIEEPNEDEKALQKLSNRCNCEARALIDILGQLHVGKDPTPLKSFNVVLKSFLKKPRVEQCRRSLREIQTEIDSRILRMVRDGQSAICASLNDISKEHTSLQLESRSYIEEMKARIREDIGQHGEKLGDLVRLTKNLHALGEEGRRVAKEERIIKSLQFDEWRRRFTDVLKSHPRTFDWMLRTPNDEGSSTPGKRTSSLRTKEVDVLPSEVPPPTNFEHWLRYENGLYWISGKAGSGKSTLMKYLTKHQIVQQCLQAWAGPNIKSVPIPWFFWNAGSPIQRSREGLFRSLLLQIFRRLPCLMPIACPDRWSNDFFIDEFDDFDELSEVFYAVASQKLSTFRLCIFIDGLDEYEGGPEEVIEVLRRIKTSDVLKICASSRPWPEFQTAFGEDIATRSIQLEKYTKPDIERFVRDLLEKSSAFTEAQRKDQQYRLFNYEIVQRANGVFLWVYLIVHEILRGLGARANLEDLQRRLDTLPQTLEEYFQQIFKRAIAKADYMPSARVFLMTIHAFQPLSVTAYHYFKRYEKDLDFALGLIDPISESELQDLQREVNDRINYLCKDLLEVKPITRNGSLVDYKVEFLHRSVKDFLNDKDMHELLIKRATDRYTQKWNVHRTLCHVSLARAKSLPLQNSIRNDPTGLFGLVDELMFYAHEYEFDQKEPLIDVLDELDRVVSAYAEKDMYCHWTNARDLPSGPYFDEENHNTFLALTIQARLHRYVSQKLDKQPASLTKKKGRPLLDYALRPNIVTPAKLPHFVDFISFDLVSTLLEKGADPNQKVAIYGNVTLWALFLLSCYATKNNASTKTKNEWFKAAELMIRKGADRDLVLETTKTETYNPNSSAESQVTVFETAKYRRKLTSRGGIDAKELLVTVKLTALEIIEDIFGNGKIGEIKAIVPERRDRGWRVWALLGWN